MEPRRHFLATAGCALACTALAAAKNSMGFSAADVAGNLAVIRCTAKGEEKAYCGFVGIMDGKPYLVTNQHYLLGSDRITFSSPSGRALKPRSVEISPAHNLVRLALAEGTGFNMAADVSMGDEVAVYGSNDAKGAKTEFHGKVSGLGADMVEVTAKFGEANGGAPVLNTNHEVVAIASHIRESRNHAMKKGTRFEHKTRRFCQRFGRIQWNPVNWKRFNRKYGIPYRDSATMINDLITILNSWAEAPLEEVRFGEHHDKQLASWLESHNAVVANPVDIGDGRREFYADYSASTEKLSALCQTQARKLTLLCEQRDITEFLADELDMQAALLESAAEVIDRYGASTY